MAVSRVCFHCSEVKRCRFYQTARDPDSHEPWETMEYFCRKCARELGHVPPRPRRAPTPGKEHRP